MGAPERTAAFRACRAPGPTADGGRPRQEGGELLRGERGALRAAGTKTSASGGLRRAAAGGREAGPAVQPAPDDGRDPEAEGHDGGQGGQAGGDAPRGTVREQERATGRGGWGVTGVRD